MANSATHQSVTVEPKRNKNSDLNTILPVTSVRLIAIKPAHCAKPMSLILVPHSFVHVTRWIATRAVSLSDVVDPVSVVIRNVVAVIV